jgi:hypothetical protein
MPFGKCLVTTDKKRINIPTWPLPFPITGSNDGPFYGALGANTCGDYVCVNNILNCKNHIDDTSNRPAVKGETYYATGTTKLIYYTWCSSPNEYILRFKGIYSRKEFYSQDYSKINPTEPEYLSTIYWKYQLIVSSIKETELSFYTSDITGRYKIVIQGVTGNDVTYGEATFNVVKPR